MLSHGNPILLQGPEAEHQLHYAARLLPGHWVAANILPFTVQMVILPLLNTPKSFWNTRGRSPGHLLPFLKVTVKL